VDEAWNGARTNASLALHTMARLGRPEQAAARMHQLDGHLQGPLLMARVAHVAALDAGDAAGLVEAGEAFERVGSLLCAAEAFADASRAYRRAGRTRDATNAATRSTELAQQCEGAATPALRLTDEAIPLTRREREIALLAANGLTSRVIAERLVLSPRTVDNHLQRVYDKLGVSGREGLAAALLTPQVE
jgi:DNA-binding CsgD family transcriptional regulator